ncbi:MAG: hypothetical protein EXR63_05725 [Dehalococcoidia bacterium]|nr:hypothetical protein [Dehalococcoidia bacterium]
MSLDISTVTGLPAYPPLVDAAVMLAPLAVVGLVVTGWRASWRRTFGPVVLALAAGGALAAWLATLSGGPLERQLREVARAAGEPRPRFGDQAALRAVTFAVTALLFVVVDRWGPRLRLPGWAARGSYAVSVLVGSGTVFAIVRAGHTGAALAWKYAR